MCQSSLSVFSISIPSFACFVEQQRMFVLHWPCREYPRQHLYIYIIYSNKIREAKALTSKPRELFTYTITTHYVLNLKIVVFSGCYAPPQYPSQTVAHRKALVWYCWWLAATPFSFSLTTIRAKSWMLFAGHAAWKRHASYGILDKPIILPTRSGGS